MQKQTFSEMLTQSEIPVLVDFWAEWCQPCHVLSPIVEQLAGEMSGKMKVIKVNVDQNPTTQTAYSIQGIPTLILFQKGNIIWRSTGVKPISTLRSELESVLAKS